MQHNVGRWAEECLSSSSMEEGVMHDMCSKVIWRWKFSRGWLQSRDCVAVCVKSCLTLKNEEHVM